MKKVVFILLMLSLYGCFNRSLSEDTIDLGLITEESTDPDEAPTPSGIIYFEEGVCKCPEASEGYTEVIDQITYTAVDNASIRSQIAAKNYKLCTTLVTEMESLFLSNSTFNEDINFWDTSNVTTMRQLFQGARAFNQELGTGTLPR